MKTTALKHSNTSRSWPVHFGLVFFLCSSIALPQSTPPSQADLDEIINTIARVQDRIERTQRQRSTVEQELTDIEKSTVALNRQIFTIETRINEEESHLVSLNNDQLELESSKASQQQLIGQYIRSIHQTGREEYIKMLLNQESVEQASRTLNYYQYFNQARAEKVSTYNRTIVEIEGIQKQIIDTTANLQLDRQELTAQQSTLLNSQQQRQTLLGSLDTTLSQSGNELADLEIERAELEFLLAELARSLASLSLDSQPFAEQKGDMPWPSSGRLLNSFGASYGQGDLDWEGVTIAGSQGDTVQAIHHGRVIFSDWFSNSGLLLIIDHGDGYMSLYGHNQLLYKEVGDWISSGDTIAAIGNTGGRSENGVYFEIRHNGNAQDPVNWCISRN